MGEKKYTCRWVIACLSCLCSSFAFLLTRWLYDNSPFFNVGAISERTMAAPTDHNHDSVTESNTVLEDGTDSMEDILSASATSIPSMDSNLASAHPLSVSSLS